MDNFANLLKKTLVNFPEFREIYLMELSLLITQISEHILKQAASRADATLLTAFVKNPKQTSANYAKLTEYILSNYPGEKEFLDNKVNDSLRRILEKMDIFIEKIDKEAYVNLLQKYHATSKQSF